METKKGETRRTFFSKIRVKKKERNESNGSNGSMPQLEQIAPVWREARHGNKKKLLRVALTAMFLLAVPYIHAEYEPDIDYISYRMIGDDSSYVYHMEDLSREKEKRIGRTLMDYREQIFDEEFLENEDINRLQDTIVYANQGDLYYSDSDGDSEGGGLEHARIHKPIHNAVNAHCMMGGYVMITNDMINLMNRTKSNGSLHLSNAPKNIYNNSALGFVIAHEMAHWYSRDSIRMLDNPKSLWLLQRYFGKEEEEHPDLAVGEISKISKHINPEFDQASMMEMEDIADIQGIRFLDNTGVYSGSGGALMAMLRIYRYEQEGLKKGYQIDAETAQHASTGMRITHILSYMQNITDGRVEFDYLDGLRVDGHYFGFAESTKDIDSSERTGYLAGQIANAIQKGMYRRENLQVRNIGYLYDGQTILPAQSVLVLDGGGEFPPIILDKFMMTEGRLQQLVDGKEIEPVDEEEAYAIRLMEFIRNTMQNKGD